MLSKYLPYFLSLCLNRCFVFDRNPEHLETIHDDKESSLQFCACPRTPSDCICEKQRSINLEKGEIANFPDHGLFQRTNELNKAVDRGIYNKRSADDHTTLPPVINRLDSGSVLRMMYVNQPTEELRRQFLKEILRFSRMTG